MSVNLKQYGIEVDEIIRNASVPRLYELGLKHDGSRVLSSGALAAFSGEKTGRSPKDKRVVNGGASEADVWWGKINIPLSDDSFVANRGRAISYLNTRDRVYVMDGYAGWDPANQIKVRIICERPYHALFMNNMLIRPTAEQLENFGEPDYVVFNAGAHSADPEVEGVGSNTCVALSFERAEFVILGTEYAGEMKKGVFTIMNYLMPKKGVLSMHCSANEDDNGAVSIFFGLSGTGKTTLSADPHRHLIGDDEHCWTDTGVFNIEGGCYAKMIDLSAEGEPEIYNAIRFGTVLENVVYDEDTREVDFRDVSITQNTRGSYPINFIDNAKIPCIGGQPTNIVMLTCDAFGVLPPISRLTPGQAMYHFISGYTAKVAGTEQGITEPVATFSACYGDPFLVWHPTKYAELLAEKMKKHNVNAWLINTGWVGGGYGVGNRIKLKYTRAMVDAIHEGTLAGVAYETDPVFGLEIPTSCPGVPAEVLNPSRSWPDAAAYAAQAAKLAGLFNTNFEEFAPKCSAEILAAAPKA